MMSAHSPQRVFLNDVVAEKGFYSHSSGMENGIASVEKNGPDAQVADST